MMPARIAIALAGALLLGGCGLQPMYAGGGKGVAGSALSDVAVAPIPDRAGWLVGNALTDRLGHPSGMPRYRLEVELDDKIEGYGVRADNSIARERRTLRARYRLVAADKGTVLLDATAGADVGIDAVVSEYATIAAEQSALERLAPEIADRIVMRVARYVLHQNRQAPAPATR